jgi:hypothetical protein
MPSSLQKYGEQVIYSMQDTGDLAIIFACEAGYEPIDVVLVSETQKTYCVKCSEGYYSLGVQ